MKKPNAVEKAGLVFVFIAAIVAIALILQMVTPEGSKADGRMGFVLCDPESSVCVRETPKKNGLLIGHLLCGDPLNLDGKKHGEWLHVTELGMEMSEGWINERYVADAMVTVGEYDAATTTAKVRVRENVDGRILRRLKKGTEVRVLASSAEWCVTNVGFIRTEFLEEVE